MPTFDYSFTVNAPLATVSAFHHDTSVLRKLTPPPIFAQIHDYEPLAEGSVAEFTLWFGPVPVRWVAVHSEVGPHGFIDTQRQGPLQQWQHRHHFTAISATETRVQEHIEYTYKPGWRGLLSRLLFAPAGLTLLFTARKWLTRYHIARRSPSWAGSQV